MSYHKEDPALLREAAPFREHLQRQRELELETVGEQIKKVGALVGSGTLSHHQQELTTAVLSELVAIDMRHRALDSCVVCGADRDVLDHGWEEFCPVHLRHSCHHHPPQTKAIEAVRAGSPPGTMRFDHDRNVTVVASSDGTEQWFDCWGNQVDEEGVPITCVRQIDPSTPRSTCGCPSCREWLAGPGEPKVIDDDSHLRCGDADRQEAAQRLSDALIAGRLDTSEYEERVSRVWDAKTYAELRPMFADLPSAPEPTLPDPAPTRLPRSQLGRGVERVLSGAFIVVLWAGILACVAGFFYGLGWAIFQVLDLVSALVGRVF